jgi:topoisomerase IA-like protein
MWKVHKFTPTTKDGKLMHTSREEIGTIDLPFDCDGDELYDIMVERGYIESITNYNVDGDEAGIAVMGKTDADGDFYLDFVGKVKPKREHFMTIWRKHRIIMTVASKLVNIPVFYGEHPDSDFVTVSTTSSVYAPRLIEKYKSLKGKSLKSVLDLMKKSA